MLGQCLGQLVYMAFMISTRSRLLGRQDGQAKLQHASEISRFSARSHFQKCLEFKGAGGPCGFEFVPHILPDPQSIQGPDAEPLAWPGRLGHQRPSPGFSKSCECPPWHPTWPFGNLGAQAGCPWMDGTLVLFTMFTAAWKRSA